MAKQYFWDKLKRARRKMEGRSGRMRGPDISDVALQAVAGRPLDIAGFGSPQQALAGARQMDMTGGGANGVIEPGNPVALLDTTGGPAMIHEGELMVQPEGAPPNTRQVLSNEQLKEVEQRYNVPGFFTGSKRYPNWQRQQVLRRIEKDYGVRGYQGSSDEQTRLAPGASGLPLTDAPQQVVAGPGLDVQAITQTGAAPATQVRTVGGVSESDAPGKLAPGASGILDTGAPQQTVDVGLALPEPVIAEAGAVDVGAAPVVTVAPPTTTAVTVEPPEEEEPAWVQRFTGGVTPADQAGVYGAGAAEGFDFLRAVARGESPALDIAENRALEDMGARQAYEDIAFEQRVAGLDLSPSQQATLRGMHERDQRVKTGTILSDIAEQRGKSAEQAARDLVSQGLTQSRWEADFAQRLTEYGDRQGWMQYNELIRTGDFDAAADKYKDITGKDIDLGDLRDEYYDTRGADAAADLAGIVDRTWHTLPLDELGNPDWQSSSTIMEGVKRYWSWNNDGEEFDLNNPAHVTEMNDVILKSMSMSDVAENIARLKTEPWYRELETRAAANDPDAIAQLALWDGALVGLSQLSYLDGYQIGMEDGKIVFKDANGDVVYSIDPPPGVTIPDYESLGGIRELLGDEYDDILARAQADDVDENAITADLMNTYGFTATQADRAYEAMRYEGYDEYAASAEEADVTPMDKDEWIAADRPESYATAGVPSGAVVGDVWFDNGQFYSLTDDGRELARVEEGTPFSPHNTRMVDAWHEYANGEQAAGNAVPPLPAELSDLIDEQVGMIVRKTQDWPSRLTDESHPLYQALLNSPLITTRVVGDRYEHKEGLRQSDERWEYTNLEGLKSGAVVVLNGTLYYYRGRVRIDQNSSNATEYNLYDPLTGTMMFVRAGFINSGARRFFVPQAR